MKQVQILNSETDTWTNTNTKTSQFNFFYDIGDRVELYDGTCAEPEVGTEDKLYTSTMKPKGIFY